MANLLSRKENTQLNNTIDHIYDMFRKYEIVFLKSVAAQWIDRIVETSAYQKAEKHSKFTGLWKRHGAYEITIRACDVIAALKEVKKTCGRAARKAARAAK